MTAKEVRRLRVQTALAQALLDTYHYADTALVARLADEACAAMDQLGINPVPAPLAVSP